MTRSLINVQSLRWTTIALVATMYGHSLCASAGEPASAKDLIDGRTVLAKAGGLTITVADVNFQLGRTAGAALPELSTSAQQTAVDLIAKQWQALQTLRALKQGVSGEEMDAWIEASAADARQGEKSVDEIVQEVCQRSGIEAIKYRDFVAFRLAWQRYLAKHMSDINLAKHFSNQRARFDGTRFKIDLISIAAPAGASEIRRQAEARLAEVREQIIDLLIDQPDDWERLANSAAWGDMHATLDTWVRGTGDLEPTLISSLLDAEVGQVSQPIHTATGVHLTRLREIEAGDGELEDSLGEVRAHMLLYLLEHLARQSEAQLPLVSER